MATYFHVCSYLLIPAAAPGVIAYPIPHPSSLEPPKLSFRARRRGEGKCFVYSLSCPSSQEKEVPLAQTLCTFPILMPTPSCHSCVVPHVRDTSLLTGCQVPECAGFYSTVFSKSLAQAFTRTRCQLQKGKC